MAKPAGVIQIDGRCAVDTVQCAHCDKHWEVKPGSGKIRGWCQNCNRPVCGPGCAECVHREQKIENMEAGRPLNFKPSRVGILLPY